MKFLDPKKGKIIDSAVYNTIQTDIFAKDVLQESEVASFNLLNFLKAAIKRPKDLTKPVYYLVFLHEDEEYSFSDKELDILMNGILSRFAVNERKEKLIREFENHKDVAASLYAILDYVNYGLGIPIQIHFQRELYRENVLIEAEETKLIW